VRTPKSTPGPTGSECKTHAFGIADKTHGFAVAGKTHAFGIADPPAGDKRREFVSWVYNSCALPGQPLDRGSACFAIFVVYG
jgi:hypothetical protein